MKEVFLKLVSVARLAMAAHRGMLQLGYDNTPYFDIYGDAMDALFLLLQEKSSSLSDSVAFHVVNSDRLTIPVCAEILFNVYKENDPCNKGENADNG